MVRVLIVDDSTDIQELLSSLLGMQPGFQVIGTARDGLEAIDKAVELLPAELVS